MSKTQAQQMAALLAALADPTRLTIVSLLAAQRDQVCVCDITASFDLGQPTISHHLKILREAGLATFEDENVTCYALRDKVWVTDPDGASWEFFVVTNAEAEQHSANRKLDEINCACSTGSNTLKTIPLTVASTASCC